MKVFVKIISDGETKEYIKSFEELAHFLNVKIWIPTELKKLIKSENKDILFIRRGMGHSIVKFKFLNKE